MDIKMKILNLKSNISKIFDDSTLLQIILVNESKNSEMYNLLALNLLDRMSDSINENTIHQLKIKKFSVTNYLLAGIEEESESESESEPDEKNDEIESEADEFDLH